MAPQPLDLAAVETFITGVRRPEGVAVAADGTVWCGDAGGLVACRRPGGDVVRVGRSGVEPNGITLDHDGRLLVADYGDCAGLLRFDPVTEAVDLRVREVDGRPVRRANHAAIDPTGRIWCTSSTAGDDDVRAVLDGHDDGFLFTADADGTGARIVSTGLHFPNGLAFGADGSALYVAESGTRRLSRLAVDGGLVVDVAPFGPDLGGVPDGVAVDADRNVWVTLVFQRKAVVVLSPDGRDVTTVLEDPDGSVLGNPTNLAFGNDGWLYLASPERDEVLRVPCAVEGVALPPQPVMTARSRGSRPEKRS